MPLIEFLSLLPGIVTAAQIIVLAARAVVRSARRKGRRQVTVARCAIDERPVPSVVSREFGQWANVPGIGFICPQCQRVLPP
jgi:hypothetical protein